MSKKLPLKQRKEWRTACGDKIAAVEGRMKTAVGVEWKITIDPPKHFEEATKIGCKDPMEIPRATFNYIDELAKRFTDVKDQETKDEMKTVFTKPVVTFVFDKEQKEFSYCGLKFNNGGIAIVVKSWWSNTGELGKKGKGSILEMLSANAPKGKLPIVVTKAIKKDFTDKVGELEKKIKTATKLDLKLKCDWTSFLEGAKSAKRQPNCVGYAAFDYAKQITSVLEKEGKDEDVMGELPDALSKKEILIKYDPKFAKGSSYTGIDIIDGVLVVAAKQFYSNVGEVGTARDNKIIDLL